MTETIENLFSSRASFLARMGLSAYPQTEDEARATIERYRATHLAAHRHLMRGDPR